MTRTRRREASVCAALRRDKTARQVSVDMTGRLAGEWGFFPFRRAGRPTGQAGRLCHPGGICGLPVEWDEGDGWGMAGANDE